MVMVCIIPPRVSYVLVFTVINFFNKNILYQLVHSLLIFRTVLEVLAKQGKGLKGWQSLVLPLHGSNAREKEELMESVLAVIWFGTWRGFFKSMKLV